jgi:hypothetical protein
VLADCHYSNHCRLGDDVAEISRLQEVGCEQADQRGERDEDQQWTNVQEP